jgi:hypothetical protein
MVLKIIAEISQRSVFGNNLKFLSWPYTAVIFVCCRGFSHNFNGTWLYLILEAIDYEICWY